MTKINKGDIITFSRDFQDSIYKGEVIEVDGDLVKVDSWSFNDYITLDRNKVCILEVDVSAVS